MDRLRRIAAQVDADWARREKAAAAHLAKVTLRFPTAEEMSLIGPCQVCLGENTRKIERREVPR